MILSDHFETAPQQPSANGCALNQADQFAFHMAFFDALKRSQ